MNKHHLREILRDIGTGCMSLMRNGLILVGFTAVCVVTFVAARPDAQGQLRRILSIGEPASAPEIDVLAGAVSIPAAQASRMLGLSDPIEPARNPDFDDRDLPLRREGPAARAAAERAALGSAQEQAMITRYLSKKYHVSSDAVDLMVSAAYLTGQDTGVEPSLLLAVMAVESGFNPFAESVVGAQGLMQVMSKVHTQTLDTYGGARAALNPVSNIRVGALILRDCIRRGGSVKDGLRLYVGSSTMEDGGYGVKVLQERDRISLAAHGGNPPLINPLPAAPVTPKPPLVAPVMVQAKSDLATSADRDVLRRIEQNAEQSKDRLASL